MTRKNWGAQLKKTCLDQPGKSERSGYYLDEPLNVRVWHRRIHDGKDKTVQTDYAIRAIHINCFFGDCERSMNCNFPWWAVKKFKVVE